MKTENYFSKVYGAAARITTSPHGWLERSRRTNSDKIVQQASNVLSSVKNEVDNRTQSSGTLDTDTEIGVQTTFNAANCSEVVTSAEPDNVNQDLSYITGNYESDDLEELNLYLDETIEYDFDALLESTSSQEQNYIRIVTDEIAAEILKLFCEPNQANGLTRVQMTF